MRTLYQSDELVAIDKPSGVSLLEDRSGAPNLWHDIKQTIAGAKLVHRLDKGTSGVLLVALSPTTQRTLSRYFARHQIRKHYVAVVLGHFPRGDTLLIDLPLKKGRKSRYRIAGPRGHIQATARGWHIHSDEGFPSKTRSRAVGVGACRSLVALHAITGRTHQLRVHLSWIGYPIIGDHLYGAPESAEQRWPRLALHCHRLVVPTLGTFVSPMPDEFAAALDTTRTPS